MRLITIMFSRASVSNFGARDVQFKHKNMREVKENDYGCEGP